MQWTGPTASDERPVSPLPGGAVVSTVLGLLLLLFTLWITDIHVVPTREMLAWKQSQQPSASVLAALDDSSVVTLQRSACFGLCPVYRLSLYGSGRVEYQGDMFVCAHGRRTAQVDPAKVRQLVEGMVAGGYFALKLPDAPIIMDLPQATTSMKHNGRTREIRNVAYDLAPLLQGMEDRIDEVAQSAQWLPVVDEHYRALCPGKDGSQVPASWLEGVHELPECGSLKPAHQPAPKLSGTYRLPSEVRVGFVVDKAGTVSDSVMFHGLETIGEALQGDVLRTVDTWRYAPVDLACRHEMKIRFILEE